MQNSDPSNIPLELFMHISTFVPLRFAPKTLLSLAQGNRYFYRTFHPILYSRLILRREDDAIMAFQRILDLPELGLSVTQIHLMSDLSIETRRNEKPFDVLVGLQMLVNKQLVPRLVALSIYLLESWEYDSDWKPIIGHGRLPLDFWRNLRLACPRLRSLTLRNVGHGDKDRWLSGVVIDELLSFTELTSLRLEFPGDDTGPPEKEKLRILKCLPRFVSLQVLSIGGQELKEGEIFAFEFPNLKWLRLHWFASYKDTTKVMAFFDRHPQLESLSLLDCMHTWFSKDVREGFLPNLKHLKARFEDVRCLVPILPQLVSLAFEESLNAQVPYLLREVLPDGLPNLKSLEIVQEAGEWNSRKLEGALWYETLDGEFRLEKVKKRIPRTLHAFHCQRRSKLRGTRTAGYVV
ncbi:hypothetical protein BDN70DRAFT_954880 [Pholiota conissans]|uniref:F-box domain-containing protein n=1 Tax=Pholiota conissans TaxID=109636 RepID=A0A9P5YTV1_9AGAR|nr:hypothetical protein BDN70DRAFT_954880 [Pholiota conissans]